jgi:large subunit ribosomal protein L9
MATVDIILKEKIAKLGAEGDVVKVKGGFAHNYLVPQGKAYLANKRNLKQLDELQKIRAEREAQELAEAEKAATKLKRLKLKLTLATGQGGKAFGSITTSDIAKAVAESAAGIELDRHQIELEKPIKSTGVFEVPVKLHSDVNCFLKITVSAGEGAEADSAEDES